MQSQRLELVFNLAWISSSVSGGPKTEQVSEWLAAPQTSLTRVTQCRLSTGTFANLASRSKVGRRIRNVTLVGHVILTVRQHDVTE